MSDASTELSMTFSIDVALGIVTLSPVLLSDLGIVISSSALSHLAQSKSKTMPSTYLMVR